MNDNKPDNDSEELLGIGTSPLEWVFASFGGVLVVAIIGYLLYSNFTRPPGIPNLIVEQTETQKVDAGFVVIAHVYNKGDAAAAGVVISAELRDGETVLEESEATLDYVPQQSQRRVGLQFTRAPAEHQLQIRVQSFTRP
ncbi:uncharacterized protein (TIGR02588 family) [Rhodoligotrophos appendicifer]|uniref:hypothetical protein n=1 Tax=Rhodoligotrophos appendicifer TaxID=987056 RepID=UPI00117D3683|nr:hypothetical protein [Rhodoligotrophos appendicifer]